MKKNNFIILEIQGYVKDEFFEVKTSSTSFGQGTVVDGQYRLTVQVASYTHQESIKESVGIILRGVMIKKGRFTFS